MGWYGAGGFVLFLVGYLAGVMTKTAIDMTTERLRMAKLVYFALSYHKLDSHDLKKILGMQGVPFYALMADMIDSGRVIEHQFTINCGRIKRREYSLSPSGIRHLEEIQFYPGKVPGRDVIGTEHTNYPADY